MSTTDTTVIETPDSHQPAAPMVRIVHLVFGVIFLGIVAIWGLGVSGSVRFDANLAVLWPIVLILAGAAGLVAMIANTARGRRTKTTQDS